jgi:hypothetical protein
MADHLVKPNVSLAAMDSTGLESHHASAYYVHGLAKGGRTEQQTRYTRFPKVGLVCDGGSHIILAVVPGQGPGPDILHFRQALNEARNTLAIPTLTADAGHDSRATHQYAREECQVRALIPATIGCPTDKRPTGCWRSQMKSRRHLPRSGQRWQAETVARMCKRLLTSALTARTYWSRWREMYLRAITLHVMIVVALGYIREVFFRATHGPFPRGRRTRWQSPEPRRIRHICLA